MTKTKHSYWPDSIIIIIWMNQCKTCKSQEMGCGPKCLGWRTSCTVPLICWEMSSLGKADSTSLILLSFLLPFPILLNEYPCEKWCSDASSVQPLVNPCEPIGRNIFQQQVWGVDIFFFFFRMKRHFYNKQILFYITPGYWCAPGIRDYFYRYAYG